MKNKNTINHSIFKINDDESLSINVQKINAILKIFNNYQKQYLMIKNWLHISKNYINRIIKKYHDESLQKHFEIFQTLQFLRRHCWFYNMRQKIEIYIKNALIVKKINIVFIKNTKKFNIKNHLNICKTK